MSFQKTALKISQKKGYDTVQYAKLLDNLQNPVEIESVEMLSEASDSGEDAVLHEMMKTKQTIFRARLKNFFRAYFASLTFIFVILLSLSIFFKDKVEFIEKSAELMVAEVFCVSLTAAFFVSLPACCCCIKKYQHA